MSEYEVEIKQEPNEDPLGMESNDDFYVKQEIFSNETDVDEEQNDLEIIVKTEPIVEVFCGEESNYKNTKQGAKLGVLKRFECHHCEKKYLQKSSIRNHIRVHFEKKPFWCKKCGECFTQKKSLSSHIRIHVRDCAVALKCKHCSVTFATRRELSRHTRMHVDKLYNCQKCDESFHTFSDWEGHVLVHKPYKCEDCEESFRLRGQLTEHRRVHTRNRPYNCKKCGERFRISATLYAHMRKHTEDKPYNCDNCNKCFRISAHLAAHVQKFHRGDKVYNCECGESFSKRGVLTRHAATHMQQSRNHDFDCRQEWQNANDIPASNLNADDDVEHEYECKYCRLTIIGSLLVHILTNHSGEKLFTCDECGQHFTHSRTFRAHNKFHAETNLVCQ